MKQDIAMNVTMKTNRNNITIKSKLYANYKNDDIDNYSYDCLINFDDKLMTIKEFKKLVNKETYDDIYKYYTKELSFIKLNCKAKNENLINPEILDI